LGNLNTTRDFTYVSDTVTGFIQAGVSEKGLGEVFNLGTGQEIRIGDLAEKVVGFIGRKVKIEVDRERLRPEKSEVLQLISDNRKAGEILQWKPKVTFDEGLKRTIEWIAKNIDHYKVGRYEF